MKSSIFIPQKINVGFQNRSDTYTKKLAYVIYFDEKGKLRKEASWQSWRDEKIPNQEYENVPTEGFVLNKKVGDYCSDWNHRQAYVRVYDPRDFEFEITIENLLYILENTSSIKGKGLEGEFVYAWDGKDLVLIPTSSPDYIQMEQYSNILKNNETIKAKDLIIGATYLDKNNEEWIYMGKYDCYDYQYRTFENGEYKWYKKYSDLPEDKSRNCGWYRYSKIKHKYLQTNCGNRFFFLHRHKNWDSKIEEEFTNLKTVNKKFISVVNNECISNYAELFERMEHYLYYSPVDDNKDVIIPYNFEEFESIILKEELEDGNYHWYPSFYNKHNERLNDILKIKEENLYLIRGSEEKYSLKELFDFMQPVHLDKYLANGKLNRREH